MKFLEILLVFAGTIGGNDARAISNRGRFLGVSPARQRQARHVDSISSDFVEMEILQTPKRRVALQASRYLRRSYLADGWDLSTKRLAAAPPPSDMELFFNHDYVIPISIGNQSFKVSIDTTLGDTWVLQSNFTCLGPTFEPIDVCNLSFRTDQAHME
jgi:hypothetical protein